MKKQLIAGTVMLATLGAASAQSLYDIAPNNEAQESSPLKWNAGLTVGWDDNVTPTSAANSGDDVTYVSAYVGASLISITPQTTWDVFGRIGGRYYFDEPAATADSTVGQGRLGVNWAHRVSERLRFSSRNYVAYEAEPDYERGGLAQDNQVGEYLHYQSDNAVGYRWTDRFATYTGVTFRGVDYASGSSANDRTTYSFYNQFRLSTSEQTIWTLDYRYGMTSASGTAGDSTNHYITAGVEHRFSPNSVLAVKAGVQLRDVDGGSSSDSPFAEAAIRTRVNEQLSVRAFARYSVEDYGTSFGGYTYDTNNTLRVGVSSDYVVSPDLTLHGGLNYIMADMEDARGAVPAGLATADTDLLNLNLGFSYKVNEGVYVTGSYNWTDSDSDIPSRNYERNRASLGVRVEF